MQVAYAFEQLLHVTLDLAFIEANGRVIQHATEVVIHVRHDHVQNRSSLAALALIVGYISKSVARFSCMATERLTMWPFDSHLLQPQNVRMAQHFQ